MCGRYTLLLPLEVVERYLEVRERQVPESFGPALARRFNIAPSQEIVVVDANPATRLRRSRIAKWGFEAGSGGGRESRAPINARAETVATTRVFRGAFVNGRCIVPANGFYEWAISAEGGKQPYYIRPRREDPTLPSLMVFAAILTTNDAGHASCAILTRPASAALRAIHDRMPVILGSKQIGPWLAGDDALACSTLEAALARSAFDLASIAVSDRVNDVRNDEPSLVEPCDDTQ